MQFQPPAAKIVRLFSQEYRTHNTMRLFIGLTICFALSWGIRLEAQTFGADSATITNKYYPMNVGAKLTITSTINHSISHAKAVAIEVVDGISCIKIESSDDLTGNLYWWIAQDTSGAVWRLRLYDVMLDKYDEKDFLYMPANPQVGEFYTIWVHDFEVISTTETITVPAGTFSGCLHLRNVYHTGQDEVYAPGIGVIKDGEHELTSVTGMKKPLDPVTGEPDFVITAIAITPELPAVSGTFTATVTVLNQGTKSGKAGNLYVWVNKPAAATVGEKGDKSASISTLKPGQSKTVKLALTAPKTWGTFTLRAFIDAKNVTKEDDEYNNQETLAYDTGLPEFEILDAWLSPETPTAGKTFTAYVTVTNSGEVLGDAGYLDAWADSTALATPPVPGSKTKGNKYKAVGKLQPGQEKTITVTGLKAPAANAAPVLGLLIDSRAKTLELDEENNGFDLEY